MNGEAMYAKNDFFFIGGYDWEVLFYECVNCGEHYEDEEVMECSSCGDEAIFPTWNYELSECQICSTPFNTEEDLYSKENGDFEDVICVSCYEKLPDEK